MTRLNSELVLSLTDRVSGPARGVSRSIDNIKRQQQGAMGLMRRQEGLTARSAAGMGRASMMMAGVAGYAAPLAGALAVKQVVSSAADFQAAMNRVQAATAATGPEFTALGSLAKEMGRTTSFSANESALAIEMLAKNGLSAQQILDGALKTSMLTAAASGADLSTAADIVTDTMLNFKVNAKELGTVADGISGVLLASKFGIDDYRLALGQAGGVAGGLGVTMADFNTAIAATSNSFASGSDAGTSFKTFLLSLPGKSNPAKAAIKALGLEFYDAEGGMKSMGEIAQELQDGLKGLSDEARNEYLNDIFGTDAMRTAIQLGERGAEGFREVGDAIGKASAQDQAEARMKGFWGEVEKTKSALEGLAISLGDLALPSLEGGLAASRDYVAQIAAGLNKFEATLDMDGLNAAQEAVGALLGTIGEIMSAGGEGTAIERTFARIATSANLVADGINATRDALQAVGLAAPDGDTAQDRADRRGNLVDGFAKFNPVVGPAVKKVYDNFGNDTITPEKKAALEKMRPAEQYDPGSSLTYREWLQQKRARDLKRLTAEGMGVPAPVYPTAPPRGLTAAGVAAMTKAAPRGTVPIPTPRPGGTGAPIEVPINAKIDRAAIEAEIREIDQRLGELSSAAGQVAPGGGAASTVRAAADEMERLMGRRDALDAKLQTPFDTSQMDAARAAADSTGTAIKTALNVTARPTVDTGSITGAIGAVRTLAAELARIPGLARSASDAAQTARVDYSGLHADLSMAG